MRHCALPLVLLAVLGPTRAAAHAFAPAALVVQERDAGVFEVRWRLSAADTLPSVEPLRPIVTPPCKTRRPDAEAAVAFFDCRPRGLRGRAISLGGLESRRAEALLVIRWRDGKTISATLRSDTERFTVPAPEAAGASSALLGYVRLGVEHILTGWDHLLFLVGLLLLVRGTSRLVSTVTAFTLGHSATLALAALGVVRVPQPLVESLIALSIVFVAVELYRPPEEGGLARRHPFLVSLSFGLLHGLGFAGALAQRGLPPSATVQALLGFNLGVELGQLAFVACLLWPRHLWLRSAASGGRARLIPAYAIGAVAAALVISRVADFSMRA